MTWLSSKSLRSPPTKSRSPALVTTMPAVSRALASLDSRESWVSGSLRYLTMPGVEHGLLEAIMRPSVTGMGGSWSSYVGIKRSVRQWE